MPTLTAPSDTAALPALDKEGAKIRDMFAGVAPRYDLLNHLLSASLDRVWRRRAAQRLAAGPHDRVLDLCAGTGDQALADAAGGARVLAADFCVPMLAAAQPKLAGVRSHRIRLATADALVLPFPDAGFTAATVSFGLRNVADLDGALRELVRVLAPGGRLAVLEFMVPVRQPLRGLYLAYFRHLLPRIGRWLSPRGSAYDYLPASVLAFPQRDGFRERMLAAGFSQAGWQSLSGGIVGLYWGHKV